MTSSLISILTLFAYCFGEKNTNTNIVEIHVSQNFLSYNIFIILFRHIHTHRHMLKLQTYAITDCECSSKYIMLFPLVALTAEGHWELTDVRESQGISVDYEKRLSQTFPDKVCSLYSTVQCIAVLFSAWLSLLLHKIKKIQLLVTIVRSLLTYCHLCNVCTVCIFHTTCSRNWSCKIYMKSFSHNLYLLLHTARDFYPWKIM